MKRVILTISLISLIVTSTVQAGWCFVPGHGYRYFSRRSTVTVYRRPSYRYGGYSRYVRYGRYGHKNDRIAIVGNIGLGVLNMVLQDKQNDRAMDVAEREQDARLAEAEAVREEAKRQEMYATAARVKEMQAEQENKKLRQEIERLRLELQKERLQQELERQKRR